MEGLRAPPIRVFIGAAAAERQVVMLQPDSIGIPEYSQVRPPISNLKLEGTSTHPPLVA
jgi:hypothetical protein